MRAIVLALLFASASFAQTWTPVAAPTKPLVAGFQLEQSQLSNHSWLYPFTQPTPAGVYEVSNCIIDKSQKLGAWSQAKTLTLQSGWYLFGNSNNQPVTSDDSGIAWRVKVVSATQFEYTPYTPGSEHYFYCGWGGQYPQNQIAPYSFTLPRMQLLGQDARMIYRLNMFATGGRNTTVASAPVCYGTNVPLAAMEVAYSRVTEWGETQLSPSYAFTVPAPNDGWVQADTCDLGFGMQEQHPQGTLGYHLYFKLTGGVWQRVPAPHCYGEPSTADDWLWQWHDRQPNLRRVVANAPTHQPVNMPKSRLSSLQLALRNTAGNVQVSSNAVCNVYCPVIDEWRSSPVATFGRRVAAVDGGKWKINQMQSQSGHKYWPVLAVENSYSQWVGVEVQANGGSAAVTFADFSGGQCFGNRFIDCNFFANPSPAGLVCGFLIDAKSTGQYGSHVASETKLYNTKLNGDVPVWIGGQQAANVRFSETNATCTAQGRQYSAVYLECPNQVVFVNGFNVDAQYAGAVFRATDFNAKLLVGGIWVDQGFPCLLEACGISCDANLAGGKLNVRGNGPVLARYVGQNTPGRLILSDIDIQPDPGITGIDVVSGSYNLVELRFTDTYLSEFTVLREPTKDQTTAALRVIMYDPSLSATTVPTPGMRLTVPGVSPPTVGAPSASESIVFNSLTGRQQVKRANWTD